MLEDTCGWFARMPSPGHARATITVDIGAHVVQSNDTLNVTSCLGGGREHGAGTRKRKDEVEEAKPTPRRP